MQNDTLVSVIKAAIQKNNGYLSFSDFMTYALYHENCGYYQREDFRFGKKGDFTTASELSPIYAFCFANQFADILTAIPQASILELGAGSGVFARNLMIELNHLTPIPKQYFILEISQTLKKKQQILLKQSLPDLFDRFTWINELPKNFKGIIIANEVLDAIPFHTFEVNGDGLKERIVTQQHNEFSWGLKDASIEMHEALKHITFANDYRSEVNLNINSFINNLSQSLSQGYIFFADYGYSEKEYYNPERKEGTLTCFFEHQSDNNPFVRIGFQDITAHVDFTRVASIAIDAQLSLAGFCTQQAFLLSTNLLAIAERLQNNNNEKDHFNLNQAIKTLTWPTEMGERIKIMALSKKIDLNLNGFQFQNRKHSL